MRAMRVTGIEKDEDEFWVITKSTGQSTVNVPGKAIQPLRRCATYYESNGQAKEPGDYVLTVPRSPLV